MSRSLGTLTLDLIARLGGFEQGMDRASRVASDKSREIERASREASERFEAHWAGAAKAAVSVLGAIGAGAAFTQFIRNTVNFQNEQAQLAAVLVSTGQAAGFSAQQLNAMADQMSRASTLSAGEINQAQTTLLAFTGIVGSQFTSALQAAIDMSARTGMSVVSAAETIGRALDVPSQGLNALSRQGFRFTEEEKKLVKQLEETGRVAEAQQVIIKSLTGTYGGAAQAARDVLGGELIQLRKNMENLTTGSTATAESIRGVAQSLNSILESETTVKVVAGLVDGIAALAPAAAVFMGVGLIAYLGKTTAGFAASRVEALQSAAATRGAALAAREFALAKVAEAQALVASANGMQRLSVVQNALIPAQRQLTSATAAVTAANRALSSSMLALVGGPVGAISIALSAGVTAWSLWGRSGDEAIKKVLGHKGDLQSFREEFEQLNAIQQQIAQRGIADQVEQASRDAAGAAQRLMSGSQLSLGMLAPSAWRDFSRGMREVFDNLTLGEAEASQAVLRLMDNLVKSAPMGEMHRSSMLNLANAYLEARKALAQYLEQQRLIAPAQDAATAGVQATTAELIKTSDEARRYLDGLVDSSITAGLKTRREQLDALVKAGKLIFTPDDLRQAQEAADKYDRATAAARALTSSTSEAARAAKQLSEWLAEKRISTASIEAMADAYLAGGEAIKELTRRQQIEEQVLKSGEKARKAITEAILAEGRALDRLDVAKQAQESLRYIAAVNRELDVFLQRQELNVLGVGMGDRRRAELEQELAVRQEYADRRRQLEEAQQVESTRLDDKQYRDRIQALEDAEDRKIMILRRTAHQKAEAEGSWLLGAGRGLQNYFDQTSNVAEAMSTMVGNSFQNMEEALTQFVKTGKLDFRSLADSIISDMIRIQIQQSVTKPLAGLVGGIVGGLTGGSNGFAAAMANIRGGDVLGNFINMAGFSAGGYTGDGSRSDFAGFVHGREYVFDADATQRLGRPFLDRLRSYGNQSFAGNLAPVAPRTPAAAQSFSGRGGGAVHIINQTTGRVDDARERWLNDEDRAIFLRETADAVAAQVGDPNSRMSTAMNRNYVMQRRRS